MPRRSEQEKQQQYSPLFQIAEGTKAEKQAVEVAQASRAPERTPPPARSGRAAESLPRDTEPARPARRGRGKWEMEEKPAKARREPREFRRTVGDFFRSRITIGFLCVFVALVIAFVAVPMVQGMISERVPVVTVTRDLERGTLLTADMLTISEIGAIDRPQSAAVRLDQVVGTFTRYDLLQGDLVVSGKLSRERPLSNPYLYELPPGKAAISVSVKGLAEGLSGKLKPGDIVSVYAVFNKSDAEEEYIALQPPELKYVRVLAISNASGGDIDVDAVRYDGAEGAETRDADKLPATLTLLAGDYQAAALAGLDRNATIHVSLAARATDEALCQRMLAAQEAFVAEVEAEESAEKEETAGAAPVAATEALPTEPTNETDAQESEVNGPGQSPAPANG